jgi:glutathione peroxidase-family protein
VAVLGFPSNDFCTNTFGVKSPMFAKSQVIASFPIEVSPLDARITKAIEAAL